jgi:hypothetical protein
MNPTLLAQATLQKGDRLLFAMGMAPTVQAAQTLAEGISCQAECEAALTQTLDCWRMWAAQCSYHGPYAEWVQRSALVLKMLTYAPTGAIVAAPTTSLPEEFGGGRNWDYRYTWLRDATFTLYALSVLGYTQESHAFTNWLRSLDYASGEDLQIMYGIRGERDLEERELSHLDGYCGSRPVRIGNGASHQKQLDVFGEVLDYMHCFRHQGGFELNGEVLDGPMWEMMRTLVEYVCAHWREPDRGIWEVRGSLHFKQRGSFWPFICSCSCSCPSSCSPWHGFVTFMCSIMTFPTQERGTPWSTVSGTAPYPHAIVQPVAFPPPSQHWWGHHLSLCAPGTR